MHLRLVSFLYPEGMPEQQISPRLALWAQAFETWIAERQARFLPEDVRLALEVWGRLMARLRRPPWELQPGDIEAHTLWMREQGYVDGAIRNELRMIGNFYRWCVGQGVDPDCPRASTLPPGCRSPGSGPTMALGC